MPVSLIVRVTSAFFHATEDRDCTVCMDCTFARCVLIIPWVRQGMWADRNQLLILRHVLVSMDPSMQQELAQFWHISPCVIK